VKHRKRSIFHAVNSVRIKTQLSNSASLCMSGAEAMNRKDSQKKHLSKGKKVQTQFVSSKLIYITLPYYLFAH